MRISDWSSDVCSSDLSFDIIASAMIERSGIVERANIEVQVLDEHCDSTDTNIPRVVARHSRRRQGGGGQRHSEGKLTHRNSPFNLTYTSRKTSHYTLCFRARVKTVKLFSREER